MTDRHSPEQRSYNMSRIRSSNTKPDIKVRKRLFAEGFRYRINDRKLPGKPDIVLKKYNTVIFINGCFWHGHYGCKYFVIPKTRTEFWLNKITGNKNRDEANVKKLQKLGWNVITVWECDLKNDKFENTTNKALEKIRTGKL